MTLQEIYFEGKNILKNADIDSFSFDASQILNKVFNVKRTDLIIKKDITVSENQMQNFFDLINQRANGRPLQYILGQWTFMGLNLEVGEGVLIPRDDTEVLVLESIKQLKKIKNPKVVDLCSGSGAVAIAIAQALGDSCVQAIELSNVAYEFLKRNVKKNNMKNVYPIHADVLDIKLCRNIKDVDLIVSNPPYIPTNDISNLQKEVQLEPFMALDGGTNGLKFYEFFIENWIMSLKSGGAMCVEVGFQQADDVAKLFRKCFYNVEVIKDINKIDRVVIGQKY